MLAIALPSAVAMPEIHLARWVIHMNKFPQIIATVKNNFTVAKTNCFEWIFSSLALSWFPWGTYRSYRSCWCSFTRQRRVPRTGWTLFDSGPRRGQTRSTNSWWVWESKTSSCFKKYFQVLNWSMWQSVHIIRYDRVKTVKVRAFFRF